MLNLFNRDRETLLNIIYKRVLPRSVIFGSCWSAYNDTVYLDKRYEYKKINHSLHFVQKSPVEINGQNEKIHTN